VRDLIIKSYLGEYQLSICDDPFSILNGYENNVFFIIDKNISEIYKNQLTQIFQSKPYIIIEANELNKDLNHIPKFIEAMVEKNVKRDHRLIAVGGGIIQDITCFLALVLFRGMKWDFFPTTLLAQSDSCIGSKSSINSSEVKNLVGGFYPPSHIYLSLSWLKTLNVIDIKSGIGEMFKVHMIEGFSSFDELSKSYDSFFNLGSELKSAIFNSLLIKKKFIELDEFDKGPRNVMNYGHSFGHAIESATHFALPHGIAVSMGMDMANYYSYKSGMLSKEIFQICHTYLYKNYSEFTDLDVPIESFFSALSKDKKNTSSALGLILPSTSSPIKKVMVEATEDFKKICIEYFKNIRKS
jgi:3-dehydroquinate synthase